jgi:ABC-2 type transport system permease protein
VRVLRVLSIGWLLHFKIISRSPFAIGVGVTWPIVNATIAYFMYRAGGHSQTLLRYLERESRRLGTLETA